jgi:hypothetical protein
MGYGFGPPEDVAPSFQAKHLLSCPDGFPSDAILAGFNTLTAGRGVLFHGWRSVAGAIFRMVFTRKSISERFGIFFKNVNFP